MTPGSAKKERKKSESARSTQRQTESRGRAEFRRPASTFPTRRRLTGVSLVGLSGGSLEPIHDSSDEGGDKGDLGLSAGDGLSETEEEGKVAVDTVLGLESSSGLDSLPSGSDLDENSVLLDTDGLVESDQLVGLGEGKKRREIEGMASALEGTREDSDASVSLGSLQVEQTTKIGLTRDTR